MSISKLRPILLASAVALASCGDGGSGFVNSTSPAPITPTPTPTPTPSAALALIPAATTSQQFAVIGTGAADELLQVRYVQSSNTYEVQLPHSTDWGEISYLPTGGGTPINFTGGGAHLWLGPGYRYSRIFEWSGGAGGYEAIGIATPAGGVPVTGTAAYVGELLGATTEIFGTDNWDVRGAIAMVFDFAHGSLVGRVDPTAMTYQLGELQFRDTVYSTGSTTFSGSFDTSLAGTNSFSGLFTGPHAEEVIGNFAFPYQSPADGKLYQADGAFAATR